MSAISSRSRAVGNPLFSTIGRALRERRRPEWRCLAWSIGRSHRTRFRSYSVAGSIWPASFHSSVLPKICKSRKVPRKNPHCSGPSQLWKQSGRYYAHDHTLGAQWTSSRRSMTGSVSSISAWKWRHKPDSNWFYFHFVGAPCSPTAL